jgi:sterol desaturase/sphingolipid hydroxylase (fatty acid hydroxylase superfamily)/uncharacterized membrane protein YhhN
MTQFQVIVLATPVFLMLIALEYAWGRRRERLGTGRNTYQLNDSLASISLGVLSQLGGVFSKLLSVGIYGLVFQAVALAPATDFWGTWYGVLLALVFYDFCYYWLHRAGHRSAVFWAAHVVHHQSQHYNLSTALRQTGSGVLLSWIFYLPMAVAGVPPLIFGIVALVDLLYQFWVHTEQVGKLGWFDRVFCSPSNHRVHHAVNDTYVDKNYGGILVLWDRCFGTFEQEKERCVYGTRSPLDSLDPLWANLEVYADLLQTTWRARRWRDKFAVWLKPPGWQPADVAARFPKPAFDLSQLRPFEPVTRPAVQWFCSLQFVALLGGVAAVLWFAERWPLHQTLVLSLALTSAYWAIGAALQGRIGMLFVLTIESAALSTVSSALEWPWLHLVFKPLTLLLAIGWVAARGRTHAQTRRSRALLLCALAACLAGDVLLMLPGDHFIAGLACFLVAHVFFLVMFGQGLPWLPSRPALLGTLGSAAAVYAWLLPGLDGPLLQLAVVVYGLAIALMAAQALGRAQVLADAHARLAALGACLFMLSDGLLAIDRFVHPLPLAPFWVLASYYLAQLLMIHNAAAGAADG